MSGGVCNPIRWFGGKARMIPKLLPLLPSHKHYIELFGGGASLLFAKTPCRGIEVYNDIDSGLYNFFSVLADPKRFPEFKRYVEALLCSRELYSVCRDTWDDQEDSVERAVRWYVLATQSFSGCFGAGWGSAVEVTANNCAATCSSWQVLLSRLPAAHARLRNVHIKNLDWRVILGDYNDSDYLVYCDPPYIHETRMDKRYKHEMSNDDHRELVQTLLAYEGSVVLSGYPHELYAPLKDAGWDQKRFETVCSAVATTRSTKIQGKGALLKDHSRIELVWRNHRALALIEQQNMPLFYTKGVPLEGKAKHE